MTSIDDVFYIIREERKHEEAADVVIRLSKEHPWFVKFPFGRNTPITSFGGFYYTTNHIQKIEGKVYREIKFPFALRSGVIPFIEKLENFATQTLYIQWIKHKRDEEKKKEGRTG